MSYNFFIFGFGYTAKVLAPELRAHGFKVIGTSRKVDKASNLELKLIDFDSPNIENYLSTATHILVSIPPDSGLGDIVLSKFSEVIKQQTPNIRWLGYLSSTGVYGDHQGKWVTEESACNPHTPTGIQRLKAEQEWLLYAEKNLLPLHIFRLSGIYGPRRSALENLSKGKKQSIFKEHQVFCRIHVEDIVRTLLASIQHPNPLSIYNVSDDEPAPTHMVDHYAAKLLGIEPPTLIPFRKAKLSSMEHEFYTNNRRVSNLKIKQELQVFLKYPTYKEGLAEIWKTDFLR